MMLLRLLVAVVLGLVQGQSRVDWDWGRGGLLMHLMGHWVLVWVVESDGLGRVGVWRVMVGKLWMREKVVLVSHRRMRHVGE